MPSLLRSRARLRTRSLHVYKGNAEYVIELVAPVGLFGELQPRVFDPVVKSVRVTGKIPAPKRRKTKQKR